MKQLCLAALVAIVATSCTQMTTKSRDAASERGNEVGNRDDEGNLSALPFGILEDKSYPAAKDLLKLAEDYKKAEPARLAIAQKAEKAMSDKMAMIRDNIKYCNDQELCVRLMTSIEQKVFQSFSKELQLQKARFINNETLLNNLVELAGAMSGKFSSEYERQGYWINGTRKLRDAIIAERVASIPIKINLESGFIFRNAGIVNLKIDPVHSISIDDYKLIIHTEKKIDPACPQSSVLESASDIEINFFLRRTDMTKANVAQFLSQTTPLIMGCKKVMFAASQTGGYNPAKNEGFVTYKTETDYSTDYDLGIFGGIYKSKFKRYHDTIFP